ncbi:hypothetical protein D3C86_2216120 [compost metagenome]
MRYVSVYNRNITPGYAVLFQLGCQRGVAGVIFGGHNQAGGVFVNAVHNARADLAVNTGQVLAVIHQRIDQGT